MPYGLVFKAFMNEVFQEYLHRFVIIYIDILIYFQNKADNCLHIAHVIQRLKENHLYLKL